MSFSFFLQSEVEKIINTIVCFTLLARILFLYLVVAEDQNTVKDRHVLLVVAAAAVIVVTAVLVVAGVVVVAVVVTTFASSSNQSLLLCA